MIDTTWIPPSMEIVVVLDFLSSLTITRESSMSSIFTYANGFRVRRRMSCLSIVGYVAMTAHRFISSPPQVFLGCFMSWVRSSAEWYVYMRCKYESLLGWQWHGPKLCRFSLGLTLFLRNHSIMSPWAPNQAIIIPPFPVLHQTSFIFHRVVAAA